MRFAFTEQQLELRAAVRQVLERECTVGDLRAVTEGRRDPGAGRAASDGPCWPTSGPPALLVPEATGASG